MLIINGTAEIMLDSEGFTKNSRHEFNMFSREMPFEQQVNQIEEYLVSRGWDNIDIVSNGVINSTENMTHNVLQQAYEKANKEGFAVTVNNQPLT